MDSNYCPNCGVELSRDGRYCPQCGTEIGGEHHQQPGNVDGSPPQQESGSMFKATTFLLVGYFVCFTLGVAFSSGVFFLLSVLCILVSIITMYIDLRSLEGRLWDTRPITWTVAAILLYIVIVPLYVYKRRQWPHHG